MPLPQEREITYAPGDPIESSNMNSIQDGIAENHSLIRQRAYFLGPEGIWTLINVGFVLTSLGILETSTGGASASIPVIGVNQGDRIVQVRGRVDGAAAETMTVSLTAIDADGNSTFIGSATSSGAGLQWLTIGSLSADVTDGVRYRVIAQHDGVGPTDTMYFLGAEIRTGA